MGVDFVIAFLVAAIICDLVAVVLINEVFVTHGQQNRILGEQRIASETIVQH